MSNKVGRIVIFCVLSGIMAFAIVSLASKNDEPKSDENNLSQINTSEKNIQNSEVKNENERIKPENNNAKKVAPASLPKLIDLGSKGCIPCKKMEPILEELKTKYKGIIDVVFVDVNQNREAAAKYNIRLIPTQIFFDNLGQEVFRHVGFYSKQEIISKWNELGFKLNK